MDMYTWIFYLTNHDGNVSFGSTLHLSLVSPGTSSHTSL